MKRILIAMLCLVMALSMVLTSCNGEKGDTGEPGPKGDKGDTGDKGDKGDTGDTGVSIESIRKTETNGLVDTYTVTFTDGTQTTFTVTNGQDGENGDKGDKGDTGEPGKSITVSSCKKTSTDGLVDTYTITFSDNSTATFTVTNAPAACDVESITFDSETNKYKILYTDGTFHSYYFTDDCEIFTTYNEAVALGHTGTKTDWILAAMNSAKDILLAEGSPIEAKDFGLAVPMLIKGRDYFTVNREILTSKKTDIVETSGYMQPSGSPRPNGETQTYCYTQKLEVNPGQILEIFRDTQLMGFRFITAYKDGVHVGSASIDGNQKGIKHFLGIDGVNQVIITYQTNGNPTYALVTTNKFTPALKAEIGADTVHTLINGASQGGNTVTTQIINQSLVATATTLAAGTYLTLPDNHIMNNKTMSVSFDISQFTSTDLIRIGHGETKYGGSFIEITATEITYYNYNTEKTMTGTPHKHGLTLKDYVTVTIITDTTGAKVILSCGGEIFEAPRASWAGRNGQPFVVSTASQITDVTMRWTCSKFSSDIWLFGDSYFNLGSDGRWPSYFINSLNCKDYLFSGYPGRNTQSGLADFKFALQFGTPEYAVWCLGMNNGDSSSAINADYKKATDEFLAICEEKGIIPILSTIPCTPTVNNSFKNIYVRDLGYRYIDFARAVGGEAVGSAWYTGMLHTDNVHPTGVGAKALYAQVLADFPEMVY